MSKRLLFALLPLLGMLPYQSQAAPDSVTRGPYLQNGSTSAVSVRWRTNNSTNSVVRYGTSSSNLNLSVSNASSVTEHELRITGLSSNTTYYYSVGTTTTTLASGTSYFFVTAPTVAKPTRIWVLGDACTGNTTQTAVRDAYYTWTGTTHTDLWLMLGDNAYTSGLDSEYQSELFNIYTTMLRKSVLWTTLGNHDGVSADAATQTGPYFDNFTLPKQAEAGGVASGTESYYSFDYGNIHFVCLESNETDRSATGTMATWLKSDLQSNTKDWLVAFWHHPPYTKGSHNSDTETALMEMRQNILPILEDYGVDLVLCGHSHSYERSKFIDGHYGASSTFSDNTMVIQSGNGQGAGAYTKMALGPKAHFGAVYSVPGASGQTSGGTLDHPAMYVSLNVAGSLVLDINNGQLDATYLDSTGTSRDTFTIKKGGVLSGVYRISSSLAPTKCLDVFNWGGAGTPVNLWDWLSGTNQQFNVIDVGGGYYKLQCIFDPTKCLDVAGAGSADGTRVQIWNDLGNSAQKWQIIDVGGGYCKLKPQCAPGSALDDAGWGTDNGNPIIIWSDWGGAPQKWRLQKQ